MRIGASAWVWAFALAGPVIWAAHLGLVYGAVSLSAVWLGQTGFAARAAVGAITLAAAAANGWIILRALGGKPPAAALMEDQARRFWTWMAGGGAVISLAAVIYQGLPALTLP